MQNCQCERHRCERAPIVDESTRQLRRKVLAVGSRTTIFRRT